jgi:Cu/Ag efflux pump CusA
VGADGHGQRLHVVDWRTAGAVLDAYQFQRVFGVGFLALFGVSVQTGVIMLEYINQLRARRKGMQEDHKSNIIEAAVEGAVLRCVPS